MEGLYFAVGWAERNGSTLIGAAYAGARYAGHRWIARLVHTVRLRRALIDAGVVPGVSTLGDSDMDARLAAIQQRGGE